MDPTGAEPDASPPAPSALDELGALDVDGVAAAGWGSALWGVALVVLLVMGDRLPEDARWWIWVCVAGLLGGLVGLAYVLRRRAAYRARR
jgi:hypothetical protein